MIQNKNIRNRSMSYFVCQECGNVGIPVWRIHNKREKGHIKDLHCPACGKTTKHTECRDEFELHEYKLMHLA